MTVIRAEAIARIAVVSKGAEVRRGTGFLMAGGGLLLTARHVVWDAGKQRAAAGTIRVVLGAGTAREHATDATIACVGKDHDWAILRCATPPTCEPLPLERGDRAMSGTPRWVSFGHSRTGQAGSMNGAVYSGTLARVADRFELYSDQAGAAGGTDVEGLSGGPCLVYGEAVGIMTAELKDEATEKVVEGKLYALPLEVVERELLAGDVLEPAGAAQPRPGLPLGARVDVPYRGVFFDPLERMSEARLVEVGRTLGLELGGLAKPAQIERIIRALFEQGTAAVNSAVLTHHDRLHEQEKTWPELAETFWVPPAAAEKLHRVGVAGGAASLTTTTFDIARHHLRRAGYLKNGGPRGWLPTTVEVPAVAGVDLGAVIRGALQKHFKAQGPALAAAVKRKAPVCVLLDDPSPDPQLLSDLRKELPGLFFVVLDGAASAAAAAPFERISPSMSAEAEAALLAEIEALRDDMERDIQTLHDEDPRWQ